MIYIGKHKTKNKEDSYMGSGHELHREYERVGKENFYKEILFECSSEEDMNAKEAEIVDKEFVERKDTYNKILGGGVGGFQEFARLGGFARQKKIKDDKHIFQQYIEKQRKDSINSWKDPSIRKKRIEGAKNYWKTHTPPNTGNKGVLDSHFGKIRIFNDKTGESRFVPSTDKIPDGWRIGCRKLPYNIESLEKLEEIFKYYKENGLDKTKEKYGIKCDRSYLNKLYHKYFNK